MDERNKELIFLERLEDLVESFGQGSQEGVKQALRECQEEFDCVSKSHQKLIGEAFSLDEKLVKTIMKFIPSLKDSKVEYELVVCSGARCAKNGSMEIIRVIKDSLGIKLDEKTADGRIRLTSQNCFKRCGEGPNVMINGRIYTGLDKNSARELMEKIKKS